MAMPWRCLPTSMAWPSTEPRCSRHAPRMPRPGNRLMLLGLPDCRFVRHQIEQARHHWQSALDILTTTVGTEPKTRKLPPPPYRPTSPLSTSRHRHLRRVRRPEKAALGATTRLEAAKYTTIGTVNRLPQSIYQTSAKCPVVRSNLCARYISESRKNQAADQIAGEYRKLPLDCFGNSSPTRRGR